MAKKKNEAVPQTSVNNLHTNTKFVYTYITSNKGLEKESTDNQLISEGSWAASIEKMLETDADAFVILNKNCKKTAAQEILHNANWSVSDYTYYVGVNENKKSIFSELISGFNPSEINASLIVFNRNSFTQFVDHGKNCIGFFDVLYAAEKTAAIQKNIVIQSKSETSKFSNLDLLKNKLSAIKNYYFGNINSNWKKWVFGIVFLLLTMYAMNMAKNAGITGDEFTQHEFAEYILKYFTGEDDKTALGDISNLKDQNARVRQMTEEMRWYGCGFDTVAAATGKMFGVKDIMEWRHILGAIFGLLSLLFFAGIIRRATKGSWAWATIGLLGLFFVPRFFGETLGNSKDAPFAIAYFGAIYYCIKMLQNLNSIRTSYILGFIFWAAFGISIRIGGLLIFGVFGVTMAVAYIQQFGIKNIFQLRTLSKNLLLYVFICCAAFILGLVLWPYGWLSPIDHSKEALGAFSKYSLGVRQLFNGQLVESTEFPRNYAVKYLMITLPLFVIIGFFLSILSLITKKLSFNSLTFILLFAGLFPLFYIYLKEANLYHGIRHILFVVPCFSALAILGFYSLENYFSRLKFKSIIASAIALLLISLPAVFTIKNQPLHYIYFNEFAGGTKGAYGKYEMDYYLTSLKQTTDYFLENVARKEPNKQFTLLTYDIKITKWYCRNDKNVKVAFGKPEDRYATYVKWDYATFYNSMIEGPRLTSNVYPPLGTIYSALVDGKPMGVLIKRFSYEEYPGILLNTEIEKLKKKMQPLEQSLQKSPDPAKMNEMKELTEKIQLKADSAIAILKGAIEKQRTNYLLYSTLAESYMSKGDNDNAIKTLEEGLKIYPSNSNILFTLAQLYSQKQKFADALKYAESYNQIRPGDIQMLTFIAQLYAQSKDKNGFSKAIANCIKKSPVYGDIYALAYQGFRALGDETSANTYGNAAQAFKKEGFDPNYIGALTDIYNQTTGKDYSIKKFKNTFLKELDYEITEE